MRAHPTVETGRNFIESRDTAATMSSQQKIGRYEVIELLGEGAMGNVFKAHDPFINRTVAIKTIKLDQSRNESDTQEFHLRFLQEARISGALNHPNIVSVFDVGEQDGMPYIAMEYVNGRTLSQVLNSRQAPSTATLLGYIIQIANALDFAHQQGIVHRDLKPGNIMVEANGRAKIMDFGIAKQAGSNLTQTGVFLGTPSYSSPEQIKEGHVDHRSDIFSFAILAHETLTGAQPFPGQTISSILYKIANDPPTFPPDLSKRPVDVPAWRTLFNKALHKDPQRRFQSAGEFAGALVNCVRIDENEKANLGSLAGQMDATVRSPGGLSKNLKRSDFEATGITDETVMLSSTQNQKRSGKKGLIAFLTILLIALIAGGYWAKEQGMFDPKPIDPEPVPQVSQSAHQGEEPNKPAEQEKREPNKQNTKPNPGKSLKRELQLSSTPSGARVLINDQTAGTTPLTHTWDPKPKESLKIRFVLAGYDDKTITLEADPNLADEQHVELQAQAVTRQITSKPSGASISIDGNTVGTAPIDHAFTPGKRYNIKAEADAYISEQVTINQKVGDADALHFTLKPEPPPGTVIVETDLAGLQIEIDGRRQSGTTLKLKPGKYNLSIKAPKYFYEETRELEISSNNQIRIKTPIVLTLPQIDLIGGWAKVRIDGMYVMKDGEADTTPLTNVQLTAGPHTFEFVGVDDKIVAQRKIEVKRGEPIHVQMGEGL